MIGKSITLIKGDNNLPFGWLFPCSTYTNIENLLFAISYHDRQEPNIVVGEK